MPAPRSVLTALLLLTAAVAGRAANVPETDSLFISLLAGGQHFDHRTGVDDGANVTWAVGYRFSDRYSGELAAGRTETQRDTAAAPDVDADSFRADVLWHYLRGGTWQPYIVNGVGQEEFSTTAGNSVDTFANAGAGIVRHLAGPLNFRAEARALYNFDDNAWHGTASIGILVAFGGGYYGEAPPRPPATP